MNFTIVCPIHNEEKMLYLTINSIYNIEPNEVIFQLDRCVDNSEKIINIKAKKHVAKTLIFKYDEHSGSDWNFRSAFLRRDAYKKASNDIILNTSADINLDFNIKEYIKLIPKKYSLISFGYLEHPWNIQQFLRIIISESSPLHGFAGLLAISKTAWLKTEDLEDLKKIHRGEDTHLHLAIKSKFPTTHINTKSIHLRPNETKKDHYYRGVAMWHQLRRSYFTAFLHSLIMLRPAVFTGYRHAREFSIK